MRERLVPAAAALVVVVGGLVVSSAPRSPGTDVAGDGLYAVLIALLMTVAWPRTPALRLWGAATAVCWLVELAQLTEVPSDLAARWGGWVRYVLGSGFDARDLLAYVVGAAAGVALVVLMRRPRTSADDEGPGSR